MVTNSIILTSGKLTEEIYLIDLEQYNLPRVSSAFALETPESNVIMDAGTSNDVQTILKFMADHGLSREKTSYLIPSHYHFDHFGGGLDLWKEIKKSNPNVKILTTEKTRKQLQDTSLHMKRVRRTFGDFIGTMEPLPDEAYKIVDPDEPVKIPGLERKQSLQLVSTPGHTDDHVSPAFFKNGQPKFIFLSEGAGSLVHSKKLVTISSSMPPEFNFKTYIRSLEKIIDLKPETAGYGHYGVVKGQKSVREILEEHVTFSHFFRKFVKEKFTEGGGKTRYIVEQFIKQELVHRADVEHQSNELMVRTLVALVYGQLIDLGLRQPK
ncbi:MAG: MBL fold metallo-hydrolase [Candidatus Hodarchaeales archaeon]